MGDADLTRDLDLGFAVEVAHGEDFPLAWPEGTNSRAEHEVFYPILACFGGGGDFVEHCYAFVAVLSDEVIKGEGSAGRVETEVHIAIGFADFVCDFVN